MNPLPLRPPHETELPGSPPGGLGSASIALRTMGLGGGLVAASVRCVDEVDRSGGGGDDKRWRNQETTTQEENVEWRDELGLNPSQPSPIYLSPGPTPPWALWARLSRPRASYQASPLKPWAGPSWAYTRKVWATLLFIIFLVTLM
jgi:hypothetical protein